MNSLHSPLSNAFLQTGLPAYHTPIQHSRVSHPHPYSRPVSSSSAAAGLDSPEPSPYAGLTKKQRKTFKSETKHIEAQVELWSAVFEDIYNQSPDRLVLVNSLARVCDLMSETRTFSSLTTKDYGVLNPGEMGPIICVDLALQSKVSTDRIPTDFWLSLQTLRRTSSRSMEMGVRQIIGHFLAYAVDIARDLFNMKRLVVHTEIEIPAVEIPNIGKVQGPMDYLTCPAAGYLSMGKDRSE